jgi:RNA polymerase-binding protein DksA
MQRRTDIDFEEFRKLLNAERTQLLSLHQQQHADMLEEASDIADNERSTAGGSAAELADRVRDAALDVNLQGELHEIDRALARIDDGVYGICVVTGQPIPVERLRALPWATMTVEAAEQAVQ